MYSKYELYISQTFVTRKLPVLNFTILVKSDNDDDLKTDQWECFGSKGGNCQHVL